MIDLTDFRRRADDLDAQGGELTADLMRQAADEIEVSRRYDHGAVAKDVAWLVVTARSWIRTRP